VGVPWMPNNLVFGGCSFGDVCEKVVDMNKSVSRSYLWQSSQRDPEVFLYVQGNHFIQVENGQHLILALGHLSNKAGDVGEAALRGIEHDLHHDIRPSISDLEGSFSLIVVDKSAGKITIYRNICGVPDIYYRSAKRLTLFSDSLSFLAGILSNILNEKLLLDNSQLPYHFLYSSICIGKTLFYGIRSVMPGEQVCIDKGTESHTQLMRIDDITGSRPENCQEALEHVMRTIMAEYIATYPDAVNIFSGGVDSSYVQAHLSKLLDRTIRTFSTVVVYPSRTWQAEYDYALSGSDFFETDHTFVKVKPLEYPDLLVRAIGELGRPPRGSQTPLILKLWEEVKKTACTALMGTAADTLFGMAEELAYIDRAMIFEKLIPVKRFRTILSRVVESLPLGSQRREKLARFLKHFTHGLALDFHDTLSPMHPFNLTHPARLEATSKLFGHHKVAKVISERQTQMKYFHIHGSLKERLHNLLLLNVGLLDAEDCYELASFVGLRVVFPFLDSRMISIALSMRDSRFPFGTCKKVTRSALRRYLPRELVYRKKTGWGLPVREWMNCGGVLHPLLQDVRANMFPGYNVSADARRANSFDWLLLCFNLWHRLFLEKQLTLNLK